MASTSTNEQIFRYDVFLNHRGPDTKLQFLGPLIDKLREAGIKRPFLDQQTIRRGDRVFQVIKEALDSARMHIAVFSSSYAKSTYCLNELQDMLRTGRPIIPVFYDVAPEQVRRPRDPSGPFEEDFRKHLGREEPQVVRGWVSAMEEAAELFGFERDSPEYRGKEELLLKVIVDHVVRLLSPTTVTIQPLGGQYDKISYYKLPTKVSPNSVPFMKMDPHFLRETSEQIFQYDVFLNHRGGPDTKEQFLVPLIVKLREAGIKRPFLDQQGIHRGEPVFQVIDTALNSARMHIAVISSSYAQSQYCLNELQDMLRTGRPVIPVFYDVKPEHVRRPKNPSGPFEEAYRRHLERQMPQVVEGWVAAQEEAAEFFGFEQDSFKYRGKDELLIKDIVDDVVRILCPTTVTIQPRAGRYDWIQHYNLPTKGQGIIFFTADTYRNLHVAFSPEAGMVFPSYEIVIGLQDSSQHTRSEIRRHTPERTVCSCSPMDLTNTLQEGNLHHFWICVDKVMQLIYVGQGEDLEEKHAFIIFKDPSFLENIQYFAFSSNQVAITYTGIRVERTRPTLFGRFGQDSSADLWSSIDASEVLPTSPAHNYGDYDRSNS